MFGDPVPILETLETADLPGSWRTLMDVCLVLGPRRDQSPRPLRETDAAPIFSTTKARREKWLSRLNSKAFILTVYASTRRLPGQDARLVSGCRPRSAGWD